MGDRIYRTDPPQRSGVASLIALLDDGVPVVGVVKRVGAEPAENVVRVHGCRQAGRCFRPDLGEQDTSF